MELGRLLGLDERPERVPQLGRHGGTAGFLLQGDSRAEAAANTGVGAGWKVLHDEAYTPIPINGRTMGAFTVVGPGDKVDASLYPWGWKALGYDDSGWSEALRH